MERLAPPERLEVEPDLLYYVVCDDPDCSFTSPDPLELTKACMVAEGHSILSGHVPTLEIADMQSMEIQRQIDMSA